MWALLYQSTKIGRFDKENVMLNREYRYLIGHTKTTQQRSSTSSFETITYFPNSRHVASAPVTTWCFSEICDP